MVNVGIIGAAGYTAGELLRILIQHSAVNISWIQSESQSGKKIYEVHEDLIGQSDLTFEDNYSDQVDVIFLCKGHGESKKILNSNPNLLTSKIIDLSQDFRLNGSHEFTYGLPELNRSVIEKSRHVANPGCFATSIQLGLIPAIAKKIIRSDVSISGITGSTGAGQSLSATSHFSWRSNNGSVYKPLNHQHLLEVGETFQQVDQGFNHTLNFIPYRGAFTRGIITTSHFDTDISGDELLKMYQEAYSDHPFSQVVQMNPDIKMVVNTNNCLICPSVIEGKAVIITVIDNLLKGASGQAVQNLNLMLGLNEKTGLNLKASAF